MLFIDSLELWQFRNYAQLKWEGLNQYNLIVGQNGQGKSNLLEAIYYLSHGRSNRSTRDQELIRHAQGGVLESQDDPFLGQGSRIALTLRESHLLEARFMSVASETGYRKWKTLFLIDGMRCKSRSEMVGRLPTVSFYLSDLEIVRGTPQHRRRWLDLATVQRHPLHLEHLQTWKKVLAEKNALLKQVDFPHPSPEHLALLDVLNIQLSHLAYTIIEGRLLTLQLLQEALPSLYHHLSKGIEGIPQLQYHVVQWPDALTLFENLTKDDWINACQARLLELLPQEIRRQTVSWGIHRDDVEITFEVGGHHVDVTTYASQGQQRSVVIALKLAELQMLQGTLHQNPIILLDDIMAELDVERQQSLLHLFPESSQVFLSTPYVEAHTHFKALLDEKKQGISTWLVKDGAIHRHLL
jgi:DNA replication and repair protein RecF